MQGFSLAVIPAKAPHPGGLPPFACDQRASAGITNGLRRFWCRTDRCALQISTSSCWSEPQRCSSQRSSKTGVTPMGEVMTHNAP